MRKLLPTIVLAACAATGFALAQHPAAPPQPYAGQQTRPITSLSADEVDGFLRGAGMGLAKPAELNGYPGPMHVLELASELDLSADQRLQVQAAMEAMKARGRDLGAAYVAAEKAVDEAFRGQAGREAIATRVAEASCLLAEIRMAHLDAHLLVTPLLSKEQRRRYSALRGYSDASGHPATNPHKGGQHKH